MADNTPLSQHRWYRLDGAHNVRDLGGYATESGGHTRHAAVIRSDSLHHLTDADRQVLRDLGVRTIIDLRSDSERETAPGVFQDSAEMRVHAIPIIRTRPPTAALMSLSVLYRFFIEHCQAGFAEALMAIAEAAPGGVLFHCTAGKDRTGVLAALLLGIAGVPDETITADYALTGQAIDVMRPILLEPLRRMGIPDWLGEPLLSSSPALIAGVLQRLNRQYGGTAGYARAIGISDAHIERLRARVVG
jgi:protein-tyrosine phosphatase